jgi:pyruvate/2-oxoglutarate dehydrogenase complex dihydrolipoamide dehydrogenase (E3) component
VALVERDSGMYGGTCINVACIPTKALNEQALRSAAMGGGDEERAARYAAAVVSKRALTARLRQKNLAKLVSAGVEVIDGTASFVGPLAVSVAAADGTTRELQADDVVINTGSRPFVPPIEGLATSARAFVSETMMELDRLPRRLVVIGGGYIGLEFASIWANFGSDVTIVQDGQAFVPREDEEVAEVVLESLERRGITVLRSARTLSVADGTDESHVSVEVGGEARDLPADAVLVATGRRPNLEGLHPEAAGVELDERGAIRVDERLRTSAPHVWAAGDVKGGLQFTYVSLDDARILLSAMEGDASRTTANRGAVPYSVFLDPPFSRVGMTEREAREAGHDVKVARLAAAAIPKAAVLGKTDGMLKAVVDAETGHVLGAHLFCAESHELVNLLKLAIDQGIPAATLRDAIYTHPTMTEALNDLFGQVG